MPMASASTVTASATASNSEQTTKEMPDKVDENNAKVVAFTLLLSVLFGHGVNYFLHGRDTCMDLLRGGRYLGPNVWQPSGCMMHNYNKPDSSKCFEGQRVVFIGDSRMRQLYFAFTHQMTLHEVQEGKFHENLQNTDQETNTKSEFLWQPEVNISLIKEYTANVLSSSSKPLLVVIGMALWTIKLHKGAQEALDQYAVNLTQFKLVLEKTDKQTNVLWMLQAPVQENLLHESRKMITNQQVDMYNAAAKDVLRSSNVHLWSSAVMVSNLSRGDTIDGLHMNDEALNTNAQLLLNWMCNSKARPTDATCCTGLSSLPNLLQTLTFTVLLACGILSCCLKARLQHISTRSIVEASTPNATVVHNHVTDVESGKTTQKPGTGLLDAYKLTSSLAKFGLILVYFFLADRTDFLHKEQKYFTYKEFFVPVVYVVVLGLFFVKKVPKPSVLSIPQTTEWKGWMQLAILIYHITGASRKIPIYMHIRVLVASYLFLTAYGQFTASWDRQKFGLVRVCQVMFRQNLLVVLLCLVMDRPYQFYYFVPLVSFWYLLIYFLLAMPPRVTRESAAANPSHNVYMLLKLGTFAAICVTLSMSEMFFNSLFDWWPMNTLFYWPGQSLHEWWFRWRLDRYIIVYGMLFAMAYIHLRVTKKLNDSHAENLFSTAWTVISNIAGILFIAIYTAHSFMCSTKPECNEVHTYISALPVTGVIILRNTSGSLRSRYSAFFAWFGTISLELFISQYHIWLAQDTKGILVLIPGFPSFNLVISTFIFVFIAHEISCLTAEIAKVMVPEDYATTRNRFILFIIFLGALLAYSTYS